MTAERQPDASYQVGGAGVTWRETGGEVVVLDVDGSVYFGLNTTGARLWKRLTDTATRDQLVEELTASAPVGPERAGSDVDAFLADLDRHGLLTRRT